MRTEHEPTHANARRCSLGFAALAAVGVRLWLDAGGGPTAPDARPVADLARASGERAAARPEPPSIERDRTPAGDAGTGSRRAPDGRA